MQFRPPKTGRRAEVIAVWCATLVLSVLYGFLIGSWVSLPVVYRLLHWGTAAWSSRQAVTVCSALAIGGVLSTVLFFGLCVGVTHFFRLAARPPRRGIGAALLVLWALPLVYFVWDAPPIREGVTWTSLPVPVEHAAESYACLQQLIGPDAPPIPEGCYLWEVRTNVLARADDIGRAWEAVMPDWAILERLDTFPSIADLTQLPRPWDPETSRCMRPADWRRLVRVACSYALLKNAQNQPEEAARILAILRSAIRKALPYARTIGWKMVLLATVGITTETAHGVVTSPLCSAEAKRMLLIAFPPLSREEMSMGVVLTAERIEARTIFEEYVPRVGFAMALKQSSTGWDSRQPRLPLTEESWERGLSRLLTLLIYHPNRTARDICGWYEMAIRGEEKRPPDMSEADAWLQAYQKQSRLRSFGGWWLTRIYLWSRTPAVNTASLIKVRSDLLAMELARLNGKELELPDYFTGGKFLVDEETGERYSPGPDKKPGTDDDIRLSKPW